MSTTSSIPSACDVLVIGAGMAGSCLARQLKLRMPDLHIVVIDKKTSFDYWVGESTVEVWEDYMTRVLDLGPYLERHHLQKHGLRFFFDSPDKSLPLEAMSEFGRDAYHSIPARQIDRARFDSDLCAMNRSLGIDVHLGVSVEARYTQDETIHINRHQGHRVRTSAGDIRCRWLVDAAGRGSPLTRKLSLIERGSERAKSAYWGRYRNVRVLDRLGSDQWRHRVNYTQRFHSTNHFMYPGYWIWHITIDEDVVSIGVEVDDAIAPLTLRNGDELTSWLRTHRCMDEILGPEVELMDFGGLRRLSYCSKQFFSEDRWFLTGMSGVFANVLGSSTSRFYATANMFIEEMIRRDRAGDDVAFLKQASHFDKTLRSGYESTVRFLSNMARNGSFDVWVPFFGASLALYFNSVLPAATNDFAVEIATALEHGGDCHCSWQNNETIGLRLRIVEHADEFQQFLEQCNRYYERNMGQYVSSIPWEERPDVKHKIYKPRDIAEERRIAVDVYKNLCEHYLRRMADIERIAFDEGTLKRVIDTDWRSGQTLADMLSQLALRSGDILHAQPVGTTSSESNPVVWFHRRATHYVAVQILFHLNQVGVFDTLRHAGPLTVVDLAGRLSLSPNVLASLLEYVHNVDNLFERDSGGAYRLSSFGYAVCERFSGQSEQSGEQTLNLFDVRVGCFGPVWSQLSGLLKGELVYGETLHRRGEYAETGVYKLAMKFWPTLEKLLTELHVEYVVEAGLTTGLIEHVAQAFPQCVLYGLDRNPAKLEECMRRVRSDKTRPSSIEWLCGDVFLPSEWMEQIDPRGVGVLFSLHFHEFIAQGEAAMSHFLAELGKRFVGWYVIAFEQPRQPESMRAQLPEVEWLYGQSNELIHHLIGNGRILASEDWRRIAATAGCRSVREVSCGYLGYRAYVYEL